MPPLSRFPPTCAALFCAFLAGCGPGAYVVPKPAVEVRVAAAANLSNVVEKLRTALFEKSRIQLVASFGSTAQLAKQIESGAPFDIFLAADSEHPGSLAAEGLCDAPSVYAKGRVALWAPKRTDIKALSDLARTDVKVVAVANPDLAPYGRAAMEALETEHLLDRVRPKIVFAQNIAAARTYADTGNADVALTAYSLVAGKSGAVMIAETLHKPILQSLCVVSKTSQPKAAREVRAFLLGPEARRIFSDSGYGN